MAKPKQFKRIIDSTGQIAEVVDRYKVIDRSGELPEVVDCCTIVTHVDDSEQSDE